MTALSVWRNFSLVNNGVWRLIKVLSGKITSLLQVAHLFIEYLELLHFCIICYIFTVVSSVLQPPIAT